MLKRLIRSEKSAGNEKLKDKSQEDPQLEEIKSGEEDVPHPDPQPNHQPNPQSDSSDPQSDSQSEPQSQCEDLISNDILEAAANCSGSGADPQEAIEILRSIAAASPSRPIDIEMFDLVMRGLSYAADVAAAYAEGEVAGRNTRIDLLKLQAGEAGDGVPLLGGGLPQGTGRKTSIFDLAREA